MPQTPGGDSEAAAATQRNNTTARHSKWGISLAIILGSMTTSIMGGTINVALPTMMTFLRAEVNQIQWVLTAFMITRTVMMPTLGWVGGLVGNRRLYLSSLGLFLAGSMLCGLAWNIQSMVAFRIIQAMGAGYLFPLAMTIMHETFPPQERGTAMGIFIAGVSIGPAMGPWLGGYLIEHLSWRAIFYMNLPIGLIALLVGTAVLPVGGRRQRGTIDLLGLLTMAVFIVSFLLAVSQARDYGWSDTYILSLLALAGISLLAFVAAELTCAAPLVNLKLYTNVQFTLASVVTFFNAFTNFGMNFVLSLFLQRGLGFTPQQAGAVRLPSAVMRGSTSLFSGRLADRMEGRWLILSGSLILVLVYIFLAAIDIWTGIWIIVVLLMIQNLARGFIQTPIMTIVMSSLPEDQVRMGAGLRGLLNSLGSTFGVAFAGFWLQQRLAIRQQLLREEQHLAAFDVTHLTEDLRQQLLAAGDVGSTLSTKVQVVLNRWLVQEAAIIAYHDMFILMAIIVLLAAAPVLWLRHRRTSA